MSDRDGSTKIQHYRGHEIRETLAGVWWNELGATMTKMREAKNPTAAMRAINKKLGPVRFTLRETKPPVGPQPKYVSGPNAWIDWGSKKESGKE